MSIWGIAVDQITGFSHIHGFFVVRKQEISAQCPAMPFSGPYGKSTCCYGGVNTTGRRHVTITLPKLNDATVAGATEEQQVSTVRIRIVAGSDTLVLLFGVPGHEGIPSFSVPSDQRLRRVFQGLPDINEWTEGVGTYGLCWSERGQHSSRSEKWLEVHPKLGWKV